MPNPTMGEALATLEDGRELTLRFDMAAFTALEAPELGDLRVNEILAEMRGPLDLTTGRPAFRRPRMASQFALLYAATRFHHHELTVAECRDLVQNVDHNGALFWPMMRALAVSLGKENEVEGSDGSGADADPSQSGVGISTSSAIDGSPQGSTSPLSGDKPPIVTADA